MSERLWHYAQNNQACGPVPESQLQQMFNSGALSRQSYVWSPGMQDWAVAATLDPFREPAPVQAAVAVQAPVQAAQAMVFAPSELVFLNGEQFGTKAILPVHNIELPHTDVKVNGAEVARPMLSAAFLACEQAGSIRLVPQSRKVMLGSDATDIYAEPGPAMNVPWPDGSFESQIQAMVAAQGRLQVSSIVWAMLLKTTGDADRQCIDVAKEWMHQRGLLTREQGKAALFFTVYKYHLAPGVAPLLQQHPVQPVRQLLDGAKHRVGFWKPFYDEILTALNSRTHSSD